MASSDSDLLPDVRVQTGFTSGNALSDEDFESVFSNARRHIRGRVNPATEWSETDWYTTIKREDALFWTTCLFSLVATGELDRSDLQVGGIDTSALLANDDGTVTEWHRNREQAISALQSDPEVGTRYGISAPVRENAQYENERPQRAEQGDT